MSRHSHRDRDQVLQPGNKSSLCICGPASKETYRHFADGGLLQQELQVVDLLGGGRRVRGRDQVGRRRHQLQHNSELVHILLSAN